jgi:hypothetical protein
MRTKPAVSIVLALVAVIVLSAIYESSAKQAAGSKIWLGRHAEIEAFIRSAKIVGEEEIKVGVTKPQRMLLEPGGPVAAVAWSKVHGRHLGYWDSYKADIAAYEVDKLLQLDMIPPVVEKRHRGELGRASMWVDNVRMWDMKQPMTAPDPAAFLRQSTRMKMFDNFVGNTDRNAGNLLVDPAYNLILIDHTRAFTAGGKMTSKLSRIDRDLWDRMLTLTEAQLKEKLAAWISGGQIRDVLKRRDAMAREIATIGVPPS